eukprot:1162127-Pelagomonas_calceolata.AAC.4
MKTQVITGCEEDVIKIGARTRSGYHRQGGGVIDKAGNGQLVQRNVCTGHNVCTGQLVKQVTAGCQQKDRHAAGQVGSSVIFRAASLHVSLVQSEAEVADPTLHCCCMLELC